MDTEKHSTQGQHDCADEGVFISRSVMEYARDFANAVDAYRFGGAFMSPSIEYREATYYVECDASSCSETVVSNTSLRGVKAVYQGTYPSLDISVSCHDSSSGSSACRVGVYVKHSDMCSSSDAFGWRVPVDASNDREDAVETLHRVRLNELPINKYMETLMLSRKDSSNPDEGFVWYNDHSVKVCSSLYGIALSWIKTDRDNGNAMSDVYRDAYDQSLCPHISFEDADSVFRPVPFPCVFCVSHKFGGLVVGEDDTHIVTGSAYANNPYLVYYKGASEHEPSPLLHTDDLVGMCTLRMQKSPGMRRSGDVTFSKEFYALYLLSPSHDGVKFTRKDRRLEEKPSRLAKMRHFNASCAQSEIVSVDGATEHAGWLPGELKLSADGALMQLLLSCERCTLYLYRTDVKGSYVVAVETTDKLGGLFELTGSDRPVKTTLYVHATLR